MPGQILVVVTHQDVQPLLGAAQFVADVKELGGGEDIEPISANEAQGEVRRTWDTGKDSDRKFVGDSRDYLGRIEGGERWGGESRAFTGRRGQGRCRRGSSRCAEKSTHGCCCCNRERNDRDRRTLPDTTTDTDGLDDGSLWTDFLSGDQVTRPASTSCPPNTTFCASLA